ncbi:hypothetical protein ACJZ2D_016836 [Fusarium nematophilum]
MLRPSGNDGDPQDSDERSLDASPSPFSSSGCKGRGQPPDDPIDVPDSDGNTRLQIASAEGDLERVGSLLRRGANVYPNGGYLGYPLAVAAGTRKSARESKDIDWLGDLLRGGPEGSQVEVVDLVDDLGPDDELGEALHEEDEGEVEGEVEDGPGRLADCGPFEQVP